MSQNNSNCLKDERSFFFLSKESSGQRIQFYIIVTELRSCPLSCLRIPTGNQVTRSSYHSQFKLLRVRSILLFTTLDLVECFSSLTTCYTIGGCYPQFQLMRVWSNMQFRLMRHGVFHFFFMACIASRISHLQDQLLRHLCPPIYTRHSCRLLEQCMAHPIQRRICLQCDES